MCVLNSSLSGGKKYKIEFRFSFEDYVEAVDQKITLNQTGDKKILYSSISVCKRSRIIGDMESEEQ